MTTLQAVRRDVALNLHDIIALQATALGDTGGLFDAVNLTEADDWYAGCDIVCVSTADANSLNLGHRGYVTGSSEAISGLTFQPDAPQDVAAGDRFELVNLTRLGGTLADYDLWIGSAVNKAREDRASVRIDRTVGVWLESANLPGIAIPHEIEVFHSIFYTDVDGIVHYPERGSRISQRGWWIDAMNRTVRIDDQLRLDMDGGTVTMVGFGPPAPLLGDSSETTISHNYLVAQASLIAAISLQRKGRADLAQYIPYWSSLVAEEKRSLRPGNYPAGSVRVW